MKWPGKLGELLKQERKGPEEVPEPPTESPDLDSTQNLELMLTPSTTQEMERQLEHPGTSHGDEYEPPQPSDRSRDRSLTKALLNSLYDAVLILDEKGGVIATNARAASFFGYSESELWGMPMQRLITGFNSLVFKKVSDHVATGRFTVINANCMQKGGTLFPGEVAISRIHYLTETDLLVTIRNQRRKKAAERKQMLERDAAAYTGTGLIICNVDGVIEYANRQGIDLLRSNEADSVLGQPLKAYCVDQVARQLLSPTAESATWKGSANFQTAGDKTLNMAATSSYIPTSKEDEIRLVISLTQTG